MSDNPKLEYVKVLPYVVISPMKNEEKYVGRTLESMVSQTVRPLEWIVVNDGSTDRSAEIVASYGARHSWIRLLNLEGLGARLPEHYGGHVVDLIYEGLRNVQAEKFEFIVKLDCDISFEPHFFEHMMLTLERSPHLGITSGISFIVEEGGLVEERTAPGHTLGATKCYRRSCFEDIGGLVASMGWDGIDEIKARMHGWEARPLRELIFVHHRPEGMASGLLASGVERGKGSYFMGYHPIFMLFRAAYRIVRTPQLFADGIGMLVGYFSSMLRGEKRIPDRDFINFVRRQQMRKLLLLKSEV